MDQKDWKKISRIIDLALTMPVESRTTYLQNLCEDNPDMQEEIEELLSHLDQSEGLLEHHLEKNEALLEEFATQLEKSAPKVDYSLEGRKIGKWKLAEMLGHGGMGSVYKAKRIDSEIRQIGALKVMHQNLKTPDNVQRFKLEQQILAGLNHPNIASRLDGGITHDGLPYLVMEYVEGMPILNYCDSKNLTIKKRIQLFIQVCEAVQYAHKNLIVHRDLKPENIWVTNEGHIKILDFGIAKLLDPDIYDFSAIETRKGASLMSLESAAPEQVSGAGITTSTDLYALGILLYKLLAGIHPFDFKDKRYRSIMQMIQEDDPPVPSQRISKLADDNLISEIAESRMTTPSDLIRRLKGDLDAIISKTLRKESDARYNSAGQLIEDIRSYLRDKPVLARGEAFQYKVKKFFKRNLKALSASVMFILVVISLVSYYTFQLAEERNTARLEANKAEQVKSLLIEIFQSGNPFLESDAKDISVREVLDYGTEKVTQELKKQPLVQAELLEALGNVYTGLAVYPEAEPLLRQSLETYKKKLGPRHTNVARTSHILGFLLLRKGKYEEAERLFERGKQIYKTQLGENHTDYAYALKMMGYLYAETGRPKQALGFYNRAVEIYEKNNSPDIAGTLNDLGYLLKDLGEYEEAVTIFERCIRILKEQYDNPKAEIANASSGIAQVAHMRGDLKEAQNRYQNVLNMREDVFPKGHTYIAASKLRLGWVMVQQGQITAAMPMVREAYEIFKNNLPGDHWKIAASEGVLALAWIGQGKFSKAEKTLLNTYNVFKTQFGKKDWRTQSARQTLAKLYSAWGKPQKAALYYSQ